MTKKCAVLLCLLLPLGLCGCSRGRFDFHEIEKLELIQTIGIDVENEAVTVSAATGAKQSSPPTVLTNKAYTVGLALREMQTFTDKNIFFAHVGNCIVGEGTVQRGLSQYLDFVERELSVRYTTGLFAVCGGSAEDIITKVGDENGYVTELLEALKKDVRMLSESYVYSVGQVGQNMLENGYALIAAVRLTENEGIVSGGSKVNVEPAGYALIKGDKLECFIDSETAHGVNILTNMMSTDTMEAEDGEGGICALSLIGAKTDYEAVWGKDGALSAVRIKIKITGNIEELHNEIDVYDEKKLGTIAKGLEDVERKRTDKVLSMVRELGLDFVGIGNALEMKEPKKFAGLKDNWDELIKNMEFETEWDVKISRTYDIGQPLGYSEENGGAQ